MIRRRQPSKQMIQLLAAWMTAPLAWRHGYDLMKETGLSSGTLYPILMRMTAKGLVEAEWREPTQPGRPPRHAYRLTADGIALQDRLNLMAAPQTGYRRHDRQPCAVSDGLGYPLLAAR